MKSEKIFVALEMKPTKKISKRTKAMPFHFPLKKFNYIHIEKTRSDPDSNLWVQNTTGLPQGQNGTSLEIVMVQKIKEVQFLTDL